MPTPGQPFIYDFRPSPSLEGIKTSTFGTRLSGNRRFVGFGDERTIGESEAVSGPSAAPRTKGATCPFATMPLPSLIGRVARRHPLISSEETGGSRVVPLHPVSKS